MDLPFAGLHQLVVPFLDRIERLPEPQRNALGTALGLRGGHAPDCFAVGRPSRACWWRWGAPACLHRGRCAAAGPGFGGSASGSWSGHLAAGPVAVVIAVRSSGGEQYLAGLEELVVRGLADSEAPGAAGLRGRRDR